MEPQLNEAVEIRGKVVVGRRTPAGDLRFVHDVAGRLVDEGAARCEDWRDESGEWRFRSEIETSRERDLERYLKICSDAGFAVADTERGEWVANFVAIRDSQRRDMWRLFEGESALVSRISPIKSKCLQCDGHGFSEHKCPTCSGEASQAHGGLDGWLVREPDDVIELRGDVNETYSDLGLTFERRGGRVEHYGFGRGYLAATNESWTDEAGTSWWFDRKLVHHRRYPQYHLHVPPFGAITGAEMYLADCESAGFGVKDREQGVVIALLEATNRDSDDGARRRHMWRLSDGTGAGTDEEGVPLVRRFLPVQFPCGECETSGKVRVSCSVCLGTGYRLAS